MAGVIGKLNRKQRSWEGQRSKSGVGFDPERAPLVSA